MSASTWAFGSSVDTETGAALRTLAEGAERAVAILAPALLACALQVDEFAGEFLRLVEAAGLELADLERLSRREEAA